MTRSARDKIASSGGRQPSKMLDGKYFLPACQDMVMLLVHFRYLGDLRVLSEYGSGSFTGFCRPRGYVLWM